MKTLIQQVMQKAQSHVIKILTIILLLSFSCRSQTQTSKDDYTLLNKVIELTKPSHDSVYSLVKNVSRTEKLKKYYQYRYENRPFYMITTVKTIKNNGIEKDTLILDSKDGQQERNLRWNLKCKMIDSLFFKKDIERFLQLKEDFKWDNVKIEKYKKNDIKIKYVNTWGSYVSIPYYDSDNKYAIILHTLKSKTDMFIFKKEKNNWINIGRVESLWW